MEDAAAVVGGLWLSYLFPLFYIAIAAGAVTHIDLLLERPIELPFLSNVKLPLLAFFVLAPLIFLVSHAYTMAHFVILSEKAKRFHRLLLAQIEGRQNDAKSEEEAREVRAGLRLQLPSNIFVQFLAGPDEMRSGAFGLLLKTVVWATLAILPVALFLLLQLQFLPYHDWRITWIHRAALLFDLALVWWLWRKILSGRGELTRFSVWVKWAAPLLGGSASLVAFWFSWFVATFPGEWQTAPLSYVAALEPESLNRAIFSVETPTAFMRARSGPKVLAYSPSWPANILWLREFNVYEALKVDGRSKVDWKEHSIVLQGRHLENAVLDFSDLGRVDLRKADLRGASLNWARLQGASLEWAHLEGASFSEAHVEEASFAGVHAQGASFGGAHLQGASLEWGELQGALFVQAHLQGASLEGAELQGASFLWAELEGALLGNAHLEGASLDQTNLQGASLTSAYLQGASLALAQLRGSRLDLSLLWRTNWGEIKLDWIKPFRIGNADWRPLRHYGSPWTDQAYADLKRVMESIPAGGAREAALQRIARLDCRNPDKDLASCDPSSKPPQRVEQLRTMLSQPDVAEPQSLATSLRELVCSGDGEAIFILRGMATKEKGSVSFPLLFDAQTKAPVLIDEIMSPACPLSRVLSDEDRTTLLAIKQHAQEISSLWLSPNKEPPFPLPKWMLNSSP
ncbi:pentapeptide repeat-containing protein [Methylocystis parvus]|uniref:pentapeptide repeat-containing protein n=1 Tax=Methylocystis parvus TaxID=134 RepID=UPI003C737C5E